MPTSPAAGCGNAFILVWLTGWTVGVAIFDCVLAGSLYFQLRALTYPTANGTITHSGVTSNFDSNQLAIVYTYEVDGRQYRGTRYSAFDVSTNSGAWRDVAAKLPVGAPVRVYYDPNDPSDAIIHPGLTGFHLSMVWFVTPFNVIAAGGWYAYVWYRRSGFDPNNRRIVQRTTRGYRVRLPALSRFGCAAILFLAITFCGVFVWGFGFGFNPPVEFIGPAYLVAIGIAVLVGRALPFPKAWMEIDERGRVVRFPPDPKPVAVPFSTIRDVVARHEEKTDSEGDTRSEYHVEFVRTDNGRFHIATYNTSEAAEALAKWLRERIRTGQPKSM